LDIAGERHPAMATLTGDVSAGHGGVFAHVGAAGLLYE
jgi:hypothetical protein